MATASVANTVRRRAATLPGGAPELGRLDPLGRLCRLCRLGPLGPRGPLGLAGTSMSRAGAGRPDLAEDKTLMQRSNESTVVIGRA